MRPPIIAEDADTEGVSRQRRTTGRGPLPWWPPDSGCRGGTVAGSSAKSPPRGVATERTVPFASIQFSRRSLRPTSVSEWHAGARRRCGPPPARGTSTYRPRWRRAGCRGGTPGCPLVDELRLLAGPRRWPASWWRCSRQGPAQQHRIAGERRSSAAPTGSVVMSESFPPSRVFFVEQLVVETPPRLGQSSPTGTCMPANQLISRVSG